MDGTDVKRLRMSLCLTQQQMAEQLYMTTASVNRWERGHNRPSPLATRQLQRLSQQSVQYSK